MKFSLPALLLLTAALPVLAADEPSNLQYTPINRAVAGHPGSHVLNDEMQLKLLRRALKQAAAP